MIKFFALGGLEENGKNCYIIESNDEIIVIDAGNKKFDNSLLGIDLIISDYDYLIKNKKKIKGILISHSHLDRMGGLQHLLEQLKVNVPVYGSKYTIEFLKKTLNYQNYQKINYKLNFKIGSFTIETFNLSHAVFGNYGFLIAVNKEAIVYATDYNFNQAFKQNVRTDIAKIIELKNKYQIKALMTESLSADSFGNATAEINFFDSFRRYAELTEGKLFISLYSTNVSGMLNVISLAEELQKKIVILGRDLLTYVNISKTLGYIDHKPDMFIKTSNIKNYKDNDIIVVVSGNYLEPFLELEKLAVQNQSITKISDKDSVLIASHPQDEIEAAVQGILDRVSRTNCKIKYQKINISAHAHAEDTKMMINLFQPENIIPIKGEYRKFIKVQEIGIFLGYSKEQIHLLENGDVLMFDKEKAYKGDKVQTSSKLINNKENELINSLLLQDRQTISQEGYVLITLIYNRKTKQIIQAPEIISGGLMNFDGDQKFIDECKMLVQKMIDTHKQEELVMKIKNKLKRFLSAKINKNPLILTVKVEVNQ